MRKKITRTRGLTGLHTRGNSLIPFSCSSSRRGNVLDLEQDNEIVEENTENLSQNLLLNSILMYTACEFRRILAAGLDNAF